MKVVHFGLDSFHHGRFWEILCTKLAYHSIEMSIRKIAECNLWLFKWCVITMPAGKCGNKQCMCTPTTGVVLGWPAPLFKFNSMSNLSKVHGELYSLSKVQIVWVKFNERSLLVHNIPYKLFSWVKFMINLAYWPQRLLSE